MKKKNIRLIALLVALLMSVAFIASCSNSNNGSQTTGTTDADDSTETGDILIGVLSPTSGSEAYYGRDMLQSYQLAVEEINAAGGVLGRNLALYHADDACDPNTASQAAARIVTSDVDFVVGGYCSGATISALQQFYDEDLLMLISAANSTNITALGLEQTFMLNGTADHGAAMVAQLCEFLGSTKVALIHQGDAYTQNLSDTCERVLPESGLEIVTVEVMEQGSADVSAIVTAVLYSGADFVYWCGYHADGSNVIKQLRQGGYTGEIAVGDGSASVELIEACGPAGEGVYVTSPPYVGFTEGGEDFIADYNEMFGMEPGTYATLCYDTIYILKEAIEAAGTLETSAVRDAIAAIEYDGLSGFTKFTANRELAISNFIVIQIVDGEFVLISF
ncbi:MAG: branched-chain amino acid ABC transporter substrate-binding protein [Oscillospiraceae bacterium]|nr:branched-chain amino acid ABC transporter substrate-binding protein [Oscillospiraceae bacterium]